MYIFTQPICIGNQNIDLNLPLNVLFEWRQNRKKVNNCRVNDTLKPFDLCTDKNTDRCNKIKSLLHFFRIGYLNM